MDLDRVKKSIRELAYREDSSRDEFIVDLSDVFGILDNLANSSNDIQNGSGFSAEQMRQAFKDGWIKEGELVNFNIEDYR